MRRTLGSEATSDTTSPEERTVLERLDALLALPTVRGCLAEVAERVVQTLARDRTSVMAWESLPLVIYGDALPSDIRSCWIFVLRAGATTGAERHPNSHQRMMSLRGAGDIQTGGQSHLLVSDDGAELLCRWASIPPNEWHQAVIPNEDWVVLSFHTAPAEELIEERPDAKNGDITHQRHYIDP